MKETLDDILNEMKNLNKFCDSDEPMGKSIGIIVSRYADRISNALKNEKENN